MKKAWKTYSFKTLLMTILVALICGCSDDDPGEDPFLDGNAGEITATVNGSNFRSIGISSTAFVDDFGLGEQIVIGGIDVSNLDRLTGVTIVFFTSDFSQLSVGDTFSGASMDMLMTAGYAIDLDGDDTLGAVAELVASTVGTITGIDRSNKLISGTFSFDAIDDDTGDIYEVRNGVFTQIPYED